MASKFQDFLKSNQIDRRRVLVASRQIERLRPEDRLAAQKKKKAPAKAAESSEGGEEGEGEAQEGPAKPRSGRPITEPLLRKAEGGKKISGPAKTRLVRAVNRVLEQKSKDPVGMRDLF